MADPAFVQYYQRELAYYRALAQQFADQYPEVAYIITERGGDPASERLFEGAALLTARLRQRIEDDLPEIIHPVFGRLWPQYLRPIPAVTMIRFQALPNAVHSAQTIPRGTIMSSRPLDSIPSCPFQTTGEFDLLPGIVESAELRRPQPGDLQLRIRIDLGAGSFDQARVRRLRLQFLGEDEVRYSLFLWASQARRVSFVNMEGTICLNLGARQIRAVGLSSHETLCPGLPTPLPGLDLLRDYFVLPEKYLAVELHGLAQKPSQPLGARFDCIFHLGPLPDPEFSVTQENVALGCVPAINLSETIKADITLTKAVHRLRLDVSERGQVFAVERVRAYDHVRREWFEIPPLVQLAVAMPNDNRPNFVLLRRHDGVAGVQSYLAITDPEGRPTPPRTDTLQIWLTRTDGDIPLRLGADAVNVPSANSPGFATFKNIMPVMPGEALRLQHNRLWRLLAELVIHPRELASRSGLQAVLNELHGDRDGEPPTLRAVHYRESGTLYRRTLVPLRHIEIVFDKNSFSCAGHLQLFGRVVSQLFAHLPGTTVFSEVVVRDEAPEQVRRGGSPLPTNRYVFRPEMA